MHTWVSHQQVSHQQMAWQEPKKQKQNQLRKTPLPWTSWTRAGSICHFRLFWHVFARRIVLCQVDVTPWWHGLTGATCFGPQVLFLHFLQLSDSSANFFVQTFVLSICHWVHVNCPFLSWWRRRLCFHWHCLHRHLAKKRISMQYLKGNKHRPSLVMASCSWSPLCCKFRLRSSLGTAQKTKMLPA